MIGLRRKPAQVESVAFGDSVVKTLVREWLWLTILNAWGPDRGAVLSPLGGELAKALLLMRDALFGTGSGFTDALAPQWQELRIVISRARHIPGPAFEAEDGRRRAVNFVLTWLTQVDVTATYFWSSCLDE